MSTHIPPMKPMPKPGSDNYEQKLMEAQEFNSQRNLLIQSLMAQQNEKQATRSNMQKSGHDAMMAVITNFKN